MASKKSRSDTHKFAHVGICGKHRLRREKPVIYVTCETEFTQLQRQSHSGRASSYRDKIEYRLATNVLTRDLLQVTKTLMVTSDIKRVERRCNCQFLYVKKKYGIKNVLNTSRAVVDSGYFKIMIFTISLCCFQLAGARNRCATVR